VFVSGSDDAISAFSRPRKGNLQLLLCGCSVQAGADYEEWMIDALCAVY